MKASTSALLALAVGATFANARNSCRVSSGSSSSSSRTIAVEAYASSNATGTVSAAGSTATVTGNSTVSSNSTASSSGWGLPTDAIYVNGIGVGFLPDDGSGGGTAQKMTQIVSAMGGKTAAYGYYAQARSGTTFDGSQLTARMNDIKASGGVFQPAVMPTGGWQGLTASDNSQAVAIAKVMKQFTDEGLEVWLRFAHEVNYYQTDGTYQGDVNDFKAGWAAVSAAIKQYAPTVKMWYTPNVASDDEYDEFFPDDPSTVDLIGIDFYPKTVASTTFLDHMQNFHDKYTSDTTKFAIGEIGLGYSGSMADRLTWLKQMTSAETAAAMPHLNQISWFNYHKGYDFRIAAVDGDSVVASYLTSS